MQESRFPVTGISLSGYLKPQVREPNRSWPIGQLRMAKQGKRRIAIEQAPVRATLLRIYGEFGSGSPGPAADIRGCLFLTSPRPALVTSGRAMHRWTADVVSSYVLRDATLR